jgi:hypothetical protein
MKIWIGADAERRLNALGVPMEHLKKALRAGEAEANTWTAASPKAMAGLARWGRTNEYLRLGPDWQGCTYENPGGVPMTISPDGSFRIVATTGDEITGMVSEANRQPTTRYSKGTATRKAVECNGQICLDEIDEEVGSMIGHAVSSEEIPTWLLLYRVTAEGIRAELSFAQKISDKGFAEDWLERIILPTVEFDTEPTRGERPRYDDGEEGFDVVVVPR